MKARNKRDKTKIKKLNVNKTADKKKSMKKQHGDKT